MAQFTVERNFQFGGGIRIAGTTLIISDEEALAEKARGINEDTERPVSGLLNHCKPADNRTEDLLAGKIRPEANADIDEAAQLQADKQKKIDHLRGEFDRIGKSYNPAWAVDKLEKELRKAKKEAGAAVPTAKKEEVVTVKKPGPKKTEANA